MPREAVHRIPGELSFDQACNLLGNYETAYHGLIARGRLQRGEIEVDLAPAPDFPTWATRVGNQEFDMTMDAVFNWGDPVVGVFVGVDAVVQIADAERRLILATLDACEGNKDQAAKILGISLKTLYNRLNSYKNIPTSAV